MTTCARRLRPRPHPPHQLARSPRRAGKTRRSRNAPPAGGARCVFSMVAAPVAAQPPAVVAEVVEPADRRCRAASRPTPADDARPRRGDARFRDPFARTAGIHALARDLRRVPAPRARCAHVAQMKRSSIRSPTTFSTRARRSPRAGSRGASPTTAASDRLVVCASGSCPRTSPCACSLRRPQRSSRAAWLLTFSPARRQRVRTDAVPRAARTTVENDSARRAPLLELRTQRRRRRAGGAAPPSAAASPGGTSSPCKAVVDQLRQSADRASPRPTRDAAMASIAATPSPSAK